MIGAAVSPAARSLFVRTAPWKSVPNSEQIRIAGARLGGDAPLAVDAPLAAVAALIAADAALIAAGDAPLIADFSLPGSAVGPATAPFGRLTALSLRGIPGPRAADRFGPDADAAIRIRARSPDKPPSPAPKRPELQQSLYKPPPPPDRTRSPPYPTPDR